MIPILGRTSAPEIRQEVQNEQIAPGHRLDVEQDCAARAVELAAAAASPGRRPGRAGKSRRPADTRFEVEDHMASRLASVSIRGEDGKFGDIAIAPPSHPDFYGLGHSLYSTAPDYMRFLRMYLNKGQLDGRRLLSEKAINLCLPIRSAILKLA